MWNKDLCCNDINILLHCLNTEKLNAMKTNFHHDPMKAKFHSDIIWKSVYIIILCMNTNLYHDANTNLKHDVVNVIHSQAIEKVHEDNTDEKGEEDVEDLAQPVVNGLVKVSSFTKHHVQGLQ